MTLEFEIQCIKCETLYDAVASIVTVSALGEGGDNDEMEADEKACLTCPKCGTEHSVYADVRLSIQIEPPSKTLTT